MVDDLISSTDAGGRPGGADTPDGRRGTGEYTVAHRLVSGGITLLYRFWVYAAIAFLASPLLMVVVISFQESRYGSWPPQGFTTEWYASVPETIGYLGLEEALIHSIQLAIATAIVATIVGGTGAFAVVRYDFRYATTIETLLLSPLIYPWLVIGFSILLLIGTIDSLVGITIELSFWTLLAGHVLFSFPYASRAIGSSLQNYNYTLEEAAQDLGATELETYVKITFPMIRPGIISGFIFVFVLSFNQYIITLFLSGPIIDTVPLVMFAIIRNTPAAQVAAIATLLMAGTLSIVLVTEYYVGVSDFL